MELHFTYHAKRQTTTSTLTITACVALPAFPAATHPVKPLRLLPEKPIKSHTTQTGWTLARIKIKDHTGCKILQCPSRPHTSEVYELTLSSWYSWPGWDQPFQTSTNHHLPKCLVQWGEPQGHSFPLVMRGLSPDTHASSGDLAARVTYTLGNFVDHTRRMGSLRRYNSTNV